MSREDEDEIIYFVLTNRCDVLHDGIGKRRTARRYDLYRRAEFEYSSCTSRRNNRHMLMEYYRKRLGTGILYWNQWRVE